MLDSRAKGPSGDDILQADVSVDGRHFASRLDVEPMSRASTRFASSFRAEASSSARAGSAGCFEMRRERAGLICIGLLVAGAGCRAQQSTDANDRKRSDG